MPFLALLTVLNIFQTHHFFIMTPNYFSMLVFLMSKLIWIVHWCFLRSMEAVMKVEWRIFDESFAYCSRGWLSRLSALMHAVYCLCRILGTFFWTNPIGNSGKKKNKLTISELDFSSTLIMRHFHPTSSDNTRSQDLIHTKTFTELSNWRIPNTSYI